MNPTSNATACLDCLSAWVSGLAFNLARSYPDAHHLAWDLSQDAKTAITESVRKGRKSITYVKGRARGAMLDTVRNLDLVGSTWSGRCEAEAKQKFDQLSQVMGRTPTWEEFATFYPDLAPHLNRSKWQREPEDRADERQTARPWTDYQGLGLPDFDRMR